MSKNYKIPLFDLNYDAKEIDAVTEVINSKWISMGKKVELFENESFRNQFIQTTAKFFEIF